MEWTTNYLGRLQRLHRASLAVSQDDQFSQPSLPGVAISLRQLSCGRPRLHRMEWFPLEGRARRSAACWYGNASGDCRSKVVGWPDGRAPLSSGLAYRQNLLLGEE